MRVLRLGIRAALPLALLCTFAGQAWAVAAGTTTTLTTSSKTVNSRPITVLSATVKDPGAVLQGLVRFYDGGGLIGTAQIVNTGTKYTKGTANLSLQLPPGAHILKAVFAGTMADAGSTSATKSVTVAGGFSSTTIGATGSAGDYTLTGQVVASALTSPTGTVSFIDQTSNITLGSAPLGSSNGIRKFATSVSYPIYDSAAYGSPEDIVAADFNGDGILDLAVLDYDTGLSIYLGKGDGTFQAAKSFCMTASSTPRPCGIGSEPTGIAVGDFNSDGIPDLVVASGGYVSVALGKGDGTFNPPVNYDTAGSGTEVRVADLNMDGTPDLVASVSGGISVLLGNGDGTFQPHNETGLKDASEYIAIGDFNKDGIPDVVAGGFNGSNIMVLLGNGDGTFQAEKDTPIDVNIAHGHVLAVDLKGTGLLSDLAYCSTGDGGELEVRIGKGDGTFNDPQTLSVNSTFFEHVEGLTAADINGDGAMDLVVTWYGSSTDTGRVAIFTNKNDGTGALNSTATNYYVGKGPAGLVAGDFNGDGTKDLAVVDGNDGAVSVLLDSASETASAVLKNVSVPGAGTQYVFARYAGDANYATSDSTTMPLTGSGVPAPVLTSLSPSTAVAGGPAFTLTVNGSNFATGAVVKWNGGARTTAFVSSTKLTASILAADIVAAANYSVTVVSGGMTSNSLTFTVTAVAMGPVITTLSPSTATAGGPAFVMTVTGTGFASGAVVKWNGSARATNFSSATKLTATVNSADIATAGTFPVTVTSGGATSNAVSFTVTGQGGIPTLTAISPNYAIVGSPSLTMTVTGAGFVPGTSGTKVFWNGNGLATTYVSATQVTAIIPAADLTTLGTAVVTVGNSGMLAAASMPFTVAPATHTPLAYGFFNQNGAAGATSGNITCAWNSPEYLCTVTGENFYYSKYVVNVTMGTSDSPAIAAVNSIGGKVIVKMYNLSGTAIQAPFYIVVFKP